MRVFYVRYTSWAFDPDPPSEPVDYDVEDAVGLGAGLLFAPRPSLAFVATVEWALYGDISAVLYPTAGIELRAVNRSRFIPHAGIGVGRFMTGDPRNVTTGIVAAGFDYFPFRHVALRAGLQAGLALSRGGQLDDSPRRVKLVNHPERCQLGLAWYPGVP